MPMTAAQHANARRFLADPGSASQQNITITGATGGTWTITFAGQTTTALAASAGGNDVQNALAALSNIGLGNVLVVQNAGVPGTLYWFVTFAGALSGVAQPMFTLNTGSLTGTVTSDVSLVMPGGAMAFSDADLDSFYDLAASYGTPNFALAIAFCFDELLAFGAKYNDYVAGQSQEKKSQVTAHLVERAKWWHQWANADRQVQIVGLEHVPPQVKAVPVVAGTPAVGLQYGNGRRPWRRGWPWG